MNPHARAVSLLAEAGDHGEQQQEKREQAEGVGVVARHPVVAQHHQNDGRDDDRDAHEQRLPETNHGLVPARVRQVEAIDHRQTQPRESYRDRQDHGVRVGGQEMNADLADDGERDEHADLWQ